MAAVDNRFMQLREQVSHQVEEAKLKRDPMAGVLEMQVMIAEQQHKSMNDAVIGLSRAATTAVNQHIAQLVRTHLRHTALLTALLLFVVAAMAGVGGYVLGGGLRQSQCVPDSGGVACWYWLNPPEK